MTFVDTVLDALPQSGGITYPELSKKLGKAKSQIGTALRALEADGKAKREAIERPKDKRKSRQLDWQRSPKVVWRRA